MAPRLAKEFFLARQLFPLRRRGSFIEFETTFYPIIEIRFRLVSFGLDEDKTFHRPFAVHHRACSVSFDSFVKFFRSDTAHQPIVPNTDAHLAVNHKTHSAEHLLLDNVGFRLAQRFTDAVG